jgi:uncharacterized protein (DUF1778 family)
MRVEAGSRQPEAHFAMTSKPRNRIVVFRLSQEEYRSLKEASDKAGARNLSDFTRSEVLECLSSHAVDTRLARRFTSLEQQIAVVQFQLNNLLQGVVHEGIK